MNFPQKPLLRGHFHQAAFFVSVGASALLIYHSRHLLPALIYSICLMSLFGVSALYHRINWGPQWRMLMRRFDHAAIYLLIAGTITPMCLIGLPGPTGRNLLLLTWIVAILGMTFSILFPKLPKWVNSLVYVGAGLVILPYLSEIWQSFGGTNLSLFFWGSGIYALGAIVYAFKKPAFFPRVFGYHEVFHCLVIVAATMHFIMVQSLVT